MSLIPRSSRIVRQIVPVVSPHWQTHHTNLKCLCVFCPIVPTCVRKPFTCRTVRRTKPDAIRPPSTSTSRTPSQAGSAGSTSHRRHGTNGGARPGHHDVTRKCAPTQSRSQQPDSEHSSTPSAAAARAAKAALAVTVVHSPRAPRASCPAKSDSESPSAAAPIPVARPVPQYYSGVQFVSMSHLCYCCCYC